MSLVDVGQLHAGYGDAAVVHGLDLRVAPGEVVALLGPNGAGKTTTMLTIAGVLPPIAGRVAVLGQAGPERLHKRARRGLAYVSEERSVFMDLTVAQNLSVGRCEEERVYALFPALHPLRRRNAGLLSGGEQQMLALARALARPGLRLLLADELSLGLAPKTTAQLLRAVRAAADDGIGVLLVEQHVHRVLEIADRAHVLSGGRAVYEASGEQARREVAQIERLYLSRPEHPPTSPVGQTERVT